MHTKAKSRLTVILVLLSFLVISMVSITTIFALTQQNISTEVGVTYNPDGIVNESMMTFTPTDGGNSYSVTDCNTSASGTLIIPKTYNGKPVTEIGEQAFYNCYKITDVIIQDGITTIGYGAFDGCSNLTSIQIPESVTTIKYNAFRVCSKLDNVKLPSGVTEIEDSVFAGCSSLTNIEIPEGVTKIGYSAFQSCTSLSEINIPDSVEEISQYAFSSCSSLKEIDIPESLMELEDYVFYRCVSLQNVKISKNVTSISTSAFDYCKNLKNLIVDINNTTYHSSNNCIVETASNTLILGGSTSEIPLTATTIGAYAFYGRALTSITIPEGVTTIENGAFSRCGSLTRIKIPKSVVYIGGNIFTYCESLVTISVESGNPVYHSMDDCLIETASKTLIAGCYYSEIPTDGSVTSIGNGAFYGSNIASIYIPKTITTIRDNAFSRCGNLTSVTLNEGLTSIGGSCFQYCDKLTSITIPTTVTHISANVFNLCTNLNSVTFKGVNYWFVANASNATTGLDISVSDLSNTNTAATYLREAYADKNWIKKVVEISSLTFTEIDGESYMISGYDESAIGLLIIPKMYNGKSVVAIYGNAFSGCSNLTEIIIPDSVTLIYTQAFSYCENLTNVVFENSNGWIVVSAEHMTSGTSLSSTELSNASTAAQYLKETYLFKFWKRAN